MSHFWISQQMKANSNAYVIENVIQEKMFVHQAL